MYLDCLGFICNFITFFRPVRRFIELLMLLKALVAFFILIYIHIAFSQSPATCLEGIKNDWPRDGILRVEIVRPSQTSPITSTSSGILPVRSYSYDDYTVSEGDLSSATYLKNIKNLQKISPSTTLPQDINQENSQHSEKTIPDQETSQSDAIQSDSVINESQYSTEYIERESDKSAFIESTKYVEFKHVIAHFLDEKLIYTNETINSDGNDNEWKMAKNPNYIQLENPLNEDVSEVEKLVNTVWPDDQYIVEYSLEYGFLRLSAATRQQLNIPVHVVRLDPQKDQCFGDTFSRFILSEILGLVLVV